MGTITEIDIDIDQAIDELFDSNLVVWNDDHNAINYVVMLFVQVLEHSIEQAEQCAWIIHTKGKCTVKSGSHDELKPLKDLLTDGGLSTTIE